MGVSLPWLEGYWLASVIADSVNAETADRRLAAPLANQMKKLRDSRRSESRPDRHIAIMNALGHLAPQPRKSELPPRMALALHRREDPVSPAREWMKRIDGMGTHHRLPKTISRILRYHQRVSDDG